MADFSLTLLPTDQIVMVGPQPVGRIWTGYSSKGVKVECLINQIRVVSDSPQEEFEQNLKALGSIAVPLISGEWVPPENQRLS